MAFKCDKIVRNITNHSILNLMYHGVVLKNSDFFSPRHITIDQFERHLVYFRREFDIISIPEAFEYRKSGYKPPRRTLTISFDDGYLNNLNIVLPLLEKYNVKSTFFIPGICTEELEIRTLWPDIIACLRHFYPNEIIELENRRFVNYHDVETRLSLVDFLKLCESDVRDHSINQLINKYNISHKIKSVPDEIWKIMNTEELIRFSKSSLVEIGSHGHAHYNLANINLTDAQIDLKNSKESLQKAINKEIKGIAFPDGSYNPQIKDISEKLGYYYQMAVKYRFSDDKNDLRILDRHCVSSTTTYEANMMLINYSFKNQGFN